MNRTRPDLQSPPGTCGRTELQEVPVSNPAELAAYADTAEPVDEADAAFVDLGFDGDEFGSDSGDDDQIHLDAA